MFGKKKKKLREYWAEASDWCQRSDVYMYKITKHKMIDELLKKGDPKTNWKERGKLTRGPVVPLTESLHVMHVSHIWLGPNPIPI